MLRALLVTLHPLSHAGNVYSYDAIDELCVKPKNWKDLLTEEPFTRKDIIHIQDPLNVSGKLISDFHHVKFVSAWAKGSGLETQCSGARGSELWTQRSGLGAQGSGLSAQDSHTVNH